MPGNSPDDSLHRQREIFERALEIEDPAERNEFLKQECAADEALLARVRELLTAEKERPSGFLDTPAVSIQMNRPSGPTAEQLDALLPDYDVLELVGEGGMGAVYKARQLNLDRMVAIKVLPLGPDDSHPQFHERFVREARAMAQLDHPNVVTVHDFGETDTGLFYIVMEFVTGTTLRELILSGKVTSREALAIVPQICDGLQYAHDKGIVHRDIKPANILIDTEGRVKITDFGLAKVVARKDDAQLTLTAPGTFMGTPDYMAPEQRDSNGAVDHRSDIYSLGVVFYELLTGRLPRGVFDPPSKRLNVDVRLDEVVLRAMQEEPKRRYQQVSEVKSKVEEISEPPAGSGGAEPQTRRRWTVPVALVLLILFGIAAGMAWKQGWFAPAAEESGPRPDASSPPEVSIPPAPVPEPVAESPEEALRLLAERNPDFDLAWAERTETPEGPGLKIDCTHNNWTRLDLSPLQGLSLTTLDFKWVVGMDYSVIASLPLTSLSLKNDPSLSDLGFIGNMELEQLDISFTNVRDLKALRGHPLKDLDITDAPVTDLTILQELPLQRLALTPYLYRYEQLKALAKHPTLQRYGYDWGSKNAPRREFVEVLDSGSLSLDWRMRGLRQELAKANDLPELPEMSWSIEKGRLTLDLSGNPDLQGLGGMSKMPVGSLDLGGTSVPASSLKPMALESVVLSDSKNAGPLLPHVSGLSPLSVSLRELDLSRTPARNLDQLAEFSLRKLAIPSYCTVEGLEPFRSMPSLETIVSPDGTVYPTTRFWEALDNGELNDQVFNLASIRTDLRLANPGRPMEVSGSWFPKHVPDDAAGIVLTIRGEPGQEQDLSPLRNHFFQAIDFSELGIRDLSHIEYQRLMGVRLNNCTKLQSLSALTGMPLTRFELSGHTPVADFGSLTEAPLTGVCFATPMINDPIDGSFLRGKEINQLGLNATLEDWSVLGTVRVGEGIRINGNLDASAARFIGGTGTRKVNFLGTSQFPFATLAGHENIRNLTIQEVPRWSDVTQALEGVAVLSSLEQFHFECSANSKPSLAPLKGMKLQSLTFMMGPDSEVSMSREDVEVVASLPIRGFGFNPRLVEPPESLELLRNHPHIKNFTVHYAPNPFEHLTADEFWKRWDAGEWQEDGE